MTPLNEKIRSATYIFFVLFAKGEQGGKSIDLLLSQVRTGIIVETHGTVKLRSSGC